MRNSVTRDRDDHRKERRRLRYESKKIKRDYDQDRDDCEMEAVARGWRERVPHKPG